jgi:hypothetical protein
MQDILAISIVVIAAGFLTLRACQQLAGRRASACGSCKKCGSSTADRLVAISTPPAKSHEREGDAK